MSEYNLKKSGKIGQLYPVLVDAKGNVIDGFHRLEADPKWRTEKITEIDTKEKLLVARCVANWNRRQVSWEEKEDWINSLARIYKEQGLKVTKRKNEIKHRIAENTGLNPDIVLMFLKDEYKVEPEPHLKRGYPTKPASIVIEHQGGKELVERHREEVLAKEKPKIELEVREKIVKEEIEPRIREELSRDAEFIREAIEKAPEVLPSIPEKTLERARKMVEPLTKEMGVKEGTVYTVGEYECPHCKKHYLIKCNGKKDWVE